MLEVFLPNIFLAWLRSSGNEDQLSLTSPVSVPISIEFFADFVLLEDCLS